MTQNNQQLEARKKQYAENKQRKDKANREQRRREKLEGNLQNRRLSFLVNILNTYGISRTELAKRIGQTTQNIYWIFSVCDDCSLRRAKIILATLGLCLDVKIDRKESPAKIQTTEYITEDKVISKVIAKRSEHFPINWTVKIPKYISEYPDGKNLSFLARYLESAGHSISEIEKETGSSRGSIRQTFVSGHDDIDISRIYEIARVTNGEITWVVDEL